MNAIKLKQMPRYKKTTFEEEIQDLGFNSDMIGFSNPNSAENANSTPTLDITNITHVNKVITPPVIFPSNKRNKSININKNAFAACKIFSNFTILERILFGLLLLLLLCIILLTFNSSSSQIKGQEYCLTSGCITVASAILDSIDNSIDPCTDFYEYACGGWIKKNPLPDGKHIWGIFNKLWQENQYAMRKILEEKPINQSEAEKKTRVYYQACLDPDGIIEKLGNQPLISFIQKIGGWNISGEFDIKEWNFQKELEELHIQYNREAFFSWVVSADNKNSSINIIQIDQGGLSLPSRDFYLNKTQNDKVINSLLKYMIKIGELLGSDENVTRKQFEDVIEFETRLAEITVSIEDRIDEEKSYQNIELGQLQESSPSIDWIHFFQTAFKDIDYNITSDLLIGVYSFNYLQNLSSLIEEYNKTEEKRIVLANYMGWASVEQLAMYLSKPFRDALKILRKALIGSEGDEPAWRACVSDTNTFMGFALGAMFVKSVFKVDSKPNAETMIEQVRKAFEENLPNIKWMDSETRQLAKEKADAIQEMIGFPDFILNSPKLDEKYEGLEFNESEYFENNIRGNKFVIRKNIEKILKAANKSEWEMTPSTVNAYYTPTKDTMVIPAGILQAPFYDLAYPKAVNFGAMGVVMGHELTHAFDDRGRKYDKYGNLHQWWKNNTIKNFEKQINCFVEQYSSYKINGEQINGERTLGENIADNGGLKAAYYAYEKWSKNNPVELPLPGINLTNGQLFFVRFAQVWCSVTTDEALKLQLLNDPHSPSKYRVIGTISNSREFQKEFKCPVNSPMNPEKKCEVW